VGLDNYSSLSYSLNHNMGAIADTYHFREQNITLMTDEEQNRGTGLWPSAKNIVSFFPHRDTWSRTTYVLTSSKLQLQAIDNLVAGASRGDVFVFYCTVNITLLSLIDHVARRWPLWPR